MSFEEHIDAIKEHLDDAKYCIENVASEFAMTENFYLQSISKLNDEVDTLREVNDDLAEENAELKQRVAEYEIHTMELVAENTALKKHFLFST